MRRRWRLALALAGGVCVALSLPIWGWWWLAPFGYAAFAVSLRDASARSRAASGAAFGLGCFAIGLAWMIEFTIPGAAVVVVLSSLMYAGGALLVPPGPLTATIGFAAVMTLTETLRYRFPFGGLPLAGAALGQVDGPILEVARVAGDLGIVFVTALFGSGIAALALSASRRTRSSGLAVTRTGAIEGALACVLAVGITVVAAGSADGVKVGELRVAYVQGGGARGLRASDNDATAVYDRHLAASAGVPPGVDLVVWPEDVIDILRPIELDAVGSEIGALARRLDATLVVGVVEDAENQTRFRNAAVAFDFNGAIADRYDKVHRVPFGEYVPMRSLIDRLADLSDVPRDAIAGEGPGVLFTRAGPLGVVISYEVFFADRARAAVRAGGEVVLVPTNAASFRGRQVPEQEIAAARLRAVETGRAVIQAAPTGHSAFVDSDGRVRGLSALGQRQVEVATVERRRGTTFYVRHGDRPLAAIALVAALSGWIVARRRIPSLDRAVKNDG